MSNNFIIFKIEAISATKDESSSNKNQMLLIK